MWDRKTAAGYLLVSWNTHPEDVPALRVVKAGGSVQHIAKVQLLGLRGVVDVKLAVAVICRKQF